MGIDDNREAWSSWFDTISKGFGELNQLPNFNELQANFYSAPQGSNRARQEAEQRARNLISFAGPRADRATLPSTSDVLIARAQRAAERRNLGSRDARFEAQFGEITNTIVRSNRLTFENFTAEIAREFNRSELTDRIQELNRTIQFGSPRQRQDALRRLGIVEDQYEQVLRRPGSAFAGIAGTNVERLARGDIERENLLSTLGQAENRPGATFAGIAGTANERILANERARQEVLDASERRFNERTQGAFDALTNSMVESAEEGEFQWHKLRDALLTDIFQGAADNISRQIQNVLFDSLGGFSGSGGGSGLAGLAASFFTPANQGFDGIVSGRAGVDKNYVGFAVSNRERIRIETPEQQRQSQTNVAPVNVIINHNPNQFDNYIRSPRGQTTFVDVYEQNARGFR